MSEEYRWDLNNQAMCVDVVGARYGSQTFEANLCQLLLGLTERLERLVEVHRKLYDAVATAMRQV